MKMTSLMSVLFVLFLTSCAKVTEVGGTNSTNNPPLSVDVSSAWVGTYNAVTLGQYDFDKAEVSRIDNSHVRIVTYYVAGSYQYYYTLNNVSVTASVATVDETINNGYHLTGTGSLSGNNLSLVMTGTRSGITPYQSNFVGYR